MIGILLIILWTWLPAGALAFLLKYLCHKLQHIDRSLSSDIVIDKDGNKKLVEYGWQAHLVVVFLGWISLWLTLGALGATLEDVAMGVNYPARWTRNYFNGDLKFYIVGGPFALVYSVYVICKYFSYVFLRRN